MRGPGKPVEAMSDTELLAAWVVRGDGTAEGIGCLLTFVAVCAAFVLDRSPGTGWGAALAGAACPALVVGLVVTGLWSGVRHWAHRSSVAPYLREFLRRSGVTDEAATDGPARPVVLVLGARALPGGPSHAVWIAVRGEGNVAAGRIVFETTVPRLGDGAPRQLAAAELPTDWSARVAAAVAEFDAPHDRVKLSTVCDGLPFTVSVHRSQTGAPRTAEGNLCASNWRSDPGCRLADAILRAADAVGAVSVLDGAGSSAGDVTIGDR